MTVVYVFLGSNACSTGAVTELRDFMKYVFVEAADNFLVHIVDCVFNYDGGDWCLGCEC